MSDAASLGQKAPAFGTLLFRLRSFTPIPVVGLLVFLLVRSRALAGPGGESVDRLLNGVGLALAFLGQALRFYTLGLVRDGTSGQGDRLEAVVLNTQGPYAYVRNPLYLGNLGIVLGLCCIAHSPWVYAIALGFFFGEYFFIIRAEEAFLRGRFGADFDGYCQKVSRWIPRLTPAFAGKLRERFDLSRALKKEHNPFAMWALGSLLLLGWELQARGQLGMVQLRVLVVLMSAVVLLFGLIKAYKRGLFRRA